MHHWVTIEQIMREKRHAKKQNGRHLGDPNFELFELDPFKGLVIYMRFMCPWHDAGRFS